MQVEDLDKHDTSSRIRDELYDELVGNESNTTFKNGKSKSSSSINEFDQFSKKSRVKTTKWKQEIFISNAVTPTDELKRRSSHSHRRQRKNSVPIIDIDTLKRCNSDRSFKNKVNVHGNKNNNIDTRDETTASCDSNSDENEDVDYSSNIPDFVKVDVLKLNQSDNFKIYKRNKTFETEEAMGSTDNIKFMRRASSDSRRASIKKIDSNQVLSAPDKQAPERPLFFQAYEKVSLNSSLKRLKEERSRSLNASNESHRGLPRAPSDPGYKSVLNKRNWFDDKNTNEDSGLQENENNSLKNNRESISTSGDNNGFKKKIIINKSSSINQQRLETIPEHSALNVEKNPARRLHERFAEKFALKTSHLETLENGVQTKDTTPGVIITGNTSSDNPLRMKADSGDRTIFDGGSERINHNGFNLNDSDKSDECLDTIKSKNLHGEIRKIESDDKSIMSTKALRIMGVNSSALRKAQSNEIMELESPRDFKIVEENEIQHQRFSIKNVFRNTKQSNGSTSGPTTPRSLSNSPKISPRVINNKRQSMVIIRKNSLRNFQKNSKKDRISYTQGHTFIHYFPNVIANDIQYFLIDNNRITDEDRATFATASDFKDAMSTDMCANIQIQAAVLLDDDPNLKTSICNRTKSVGTEQMPLTVSKFKDDVKKGSEIFGKEYNITFIYRVIKPFMINKYENE